MLTQDRGGETRWAPPGSVGKCLPWETSAALTLPPWLGLGLVPFAPRATSPQGDPARASPRPLLLREWSEWAPGFAQGGDTTGMGAVAEGIFQSWSGQNPCPAAAAPLRLNRALCPEGQNGLCGPMAPAPQESSMSPWEARGCCSPWGQERVETAAALESLLCPTPRQEQGQSDEPHLPLSCGLQRCYFSMTRAQASWLLLIFVAAQSQSIAQDLLSAFPCGVLRGCVAVVCSDVYLFRVLCFCRPLSLVDVLGSWS